MREIVRNAKENAKCVVAHETHTARTTSSSLSTLSPKWKGFFFVASRRRLLEAQGIGEQPEKPPYAVLLPPL